MGGLFVLFAGGSLSVCLGRRLSAHRLGIGSAVVGSFASGSATVWALLTGRILTAAIDWTGMPFCVLRLELDPLSLFFAAIISLLGLLCAVYGAEYWAEHRGSRAVGLGWAEYCFLVGSMLLVVGAQSAVTFLVAWEVMSIVSFLLVLFDGKRREALEAGWVYLAAAHLGAASLMVMFLVLGHNSASLDFDALGKNLGTGARAAAFLLAMAGFGSKAGFVPMHVWLPEAHPAAPSHVSALMSGIMIKMGIYGILRVLLILGAPPVWWGWTLLGIGAVSGVLGVSFALAQHDLKRLLAYHSVENIGIIALGIGLGMLGWSTGNIPLAALGFAGGLLHVFNHAVFKGLLFLSAGSALRAAHTRDMDKLGGLMRRMPFTGRSFLLGSAAISGLPPLNGFVSEFLIYLGAFRAVSSETVPVGVRLAGILALVSLAMIGGLASACFVKATGTVFLGESRNPQAKEVREAGLSMLLPMGALSLLCVLVGLGGPIVLRVLWNLLGVFPFAGLLAEGIRDEAAGPLGWVSLTVGMLFLIGAVLLILRKALLRGKPRAAAVTWDCGYAAPSPRMQYTSSSFAAPILELFRPALRTRTRGRLPDALFPRSADLHTHTGDIFRSGLFGPIFRMVEAAARRLRPLQHGQIQSYVLYLAVTLLALLVWKLQ